MATIIQNILTVLGSILVTSIIAVLVSLGILEFRIWRIKKKVNQELFDKLKEGKEELEDKIKQEIAREVGNERQKIQEQEQRRKDFRQRKAGKRKPSSKELSERRRTKESSEGQGRIQIPETSEDGGSEHDSKRDWPSFE